LGSIVKRTVPFVPAILNFPGRFKGTPSIVLFAVFFILFFPVGVFQRDARMNPEEGKQDVADRKSEFLNRGDAYA
jgi:hypothetical protein